MMQHEFEKLIGYEVTYETYTNIIEPMYMAYPGDKHSFCEMLKNPKKALKARLKSDIVKDMKAAARKLYDSCEHYYDAATEAQMTNLKAELEKTTGRKWYIDTTRRWSCSYPFLLWNEGEKIYLV